MNWYSGKTFLNLIETIEITKNKNPGISGSPYRQSFVPHFEYHDYRGYAGRVAGGILQTGDEVTVLPSMRKSKITSIDMFGKTLSESIGGDSVAISLQDQIDISRGDMLAGSDDLRS